MMQAQELVTGAQRANPDVVFGVACMTADGLGKVAELNTRYTRSALEDALETAEDMVEGPQDLIALPGAHAAPLAENIRSCSRKLPAILASTPAGLPGAAQAQG